MGSLELHVHKLYLKYLQLNKNLGSSVQLAIFKHSVATVASEFCSGQHRIIKHFHYDRKFHWISEGNFKLYQSFAV